MEEFLIELYQRLEGEKLSNRTLLSENIKLRECLHYILLYSSTCEDYRKGMDLIEKLSRKCLTELEKR